MAIVALSNNVTRSADFDAGTGYSTSNIGGGAAPGQELVTFYEGSASVSRKVTSSSGGGWWTTLTTPVNMTVSGNRVWMCKIYLSDSADLNSTGMRVRVGSTQSDYYGFLIHDDGTGVNKWPGTRSWLIVPIDPNQIEWRYTISGTPTLTIADEFAVVAALATGVAKSENLFLDEIDISDGLYLVGGDSTDTDGTYQDFVDFDEGTQGNRWGHVVTQEGILYVVGKLIIGRTAGGSVTATVFQDTGSVIVIPESRTGPGWNELEFDISSGTTDIDLIDGVFQGKGSGVGLIHTSTLTDFNDQEFYVIMDFTRTGIYKFLGELKTGDAVLYSKQGGTDNTNLTDGTIYWIGAYPSGGQYAWRIYPTYADSLAGTSPAGVNNPLGIEVHTFQKQPDTRPYLTVTGTSGTFDTFGCTFDNFGVISLTSGATLTNTKLLNCGSLIQNSGTITNCSISGSITNTGEAFITSDNLNNISYNSFVYSNGHAIEITTPGTYSFVGNTFTGYAGDSSNNAAIYNNSGGLVTINVTGGVASPSYRNSTGSPASSTVINNNVSITFTGLKENTEVRIYDAGTGAEIGGIESIVYGSPIDDTFTWQDASANVVNYVIHNIIYQSIRVENFTVPASDTSIPIQQIIDRNYNNPQ